jgi:hypothetical protein
MHGEKLPNPFDDLIEEMDGYLVGTDFDFVGYREHLVNLL